MSRISLIIICLAVVACSAGCEKKPVVRISAEKASPGTEAESNCSDTTLNPFWPASKKEHRITKREIVVSQYSTLCGSKVLRLQTELVSATFNIQDVIEEFDKHFKVHPNVERDRALAERLRKESDTRSKFCYDEFSVRDREWLSFCFARLLEQGKFIITLRSNGQIVSQITACEWANVRGGLDGEGGRVFYLKDGRVFFWTAEWIS